MRLLIVEDRAADAELMAAQLAADGLELDWVRIETRAELLDALEESVDLVISDFELPTLDAMDVIGIVAEKAIGRPPVIVVSGTVTELTASAWLAAPMAKGTPFAVTELPRRLAAYA